MRDRKRLWPVSLRLLARKGSLLPMRVRWQWAFHRRGRETGLLTTPLPVRADGRVDTADGDDEDVGDEGIRRCSNRATKAPARRAGKPSSREAHGETTRCSLGWRRLAQSLDRGRSPSPCKDLKPKELFGIRFCLSSPRTKQAEKVKQAAGRSREV